MKWAIGAMILIIVFLSFRANQRGQLTSPASNNDSTVNSTNTDGGAHKKVSYGVFVPYWGVQNGTQYTTVPLNNVLISKLYYFGVTLNKDGSINKTDAGYTKLSTFKATEGDGTTYLVIRLVEVSTIDALLNSKNLSRTAATNSTTLANQYGFDGILIDLEYSALATNKTKKTITSTLREFANVAHENNLTISATLFGDTFYRGRPYDVKTLSGILDEVIVMVYDFHKSKSLPGPLFPYNALKYGYSYKQLVDDFLQFVPTNKLTLTYGFYGYQWRVDSKNRPIKPGVAKPYRAIEGEKNGCIKPTCIITIDSTSKELLLKTKNDDDSWSLLYSETPDSIQTKINYAQQYGVSSFAIWAFGYY